MTGLPVLLNPFSPDFWLRIGAAVLCGGVVGPGYPAAAVALAFVTVVILVGVERLEATFHHLRRGVHSWRSNPSAPEP